MKHPHNRFGRTFVFAGLLTALCLGIVGSCSLRAVPVLVADIDDLDAKAQPYFDEARRNIPTSFVASKTICADTTALRSRQIFRRPNCLYGVPPAFSTGGLFKKTLAVRYIQFST